MVKQRASLERVPAEAVWPASPRETMRRIWSPLQPALTRLTGAALCDEAPGTLTPWSHLRGALGFLAAGVSTSAVCAASASPAAFSLLGVGWLLALHGARKLRTIIMHQAAHGNFCRHRRVDRLLGKTISIILVSEEFDAYRKSHCGDHHSSRHQTRHDPTVGFLFDELGLRPGMSRRLMWLRLFATVMSPLYHARFLWTRLASHFRGTSMLHRSALVAYLISIALPTAAFDAWQILFLSWVVPVGILYQVSTAFRLSSEHVFPQRLPQVRSRASLGEFTLGIFTGTACPDPTSPGLRRSAAWVWWWTQMLLYHLPCRLAFLPGDGPVHDWHHRQPMSPDWANYLQNRARAAARTSPDEPPYMEVWGFHRAIDACFASLSRADPDDYPRDRIPRNARPKERDL